MGNPPHNSSPDTTPPLTQLLPSHNSSPPLPYPCRAAQDAPFQCIDHTYIYNLLHNLGFADDQSLRLTKKINGIETGWCLGAMIQELMNQ
jgi:hypothetical protein